MRAIADASRIDDDPPAGVVPTFHDRENAGARLSALLGSYRKTHAVVLGLARGGVPVAAAVARALEAELDVLVVRKLGSPISDELAIGAVTSDGGRYLNTGMIRDLGVSQAYVERVTNAQISAAKRLAVQLRAGAPAPDLAHRTVILVDDGLATGATMIAAARSVRAQRPQRLVIGVPVGSRQACAILQTEADEVVCLATPDPFWAVGVYYDDFSQTENAEVAHLLGEARARTSGAAQSLA
jgi:putative phosphoribosyl transferase